MKKILIVCLLFSLSVFANDGVLLHTNKGDITLKLYPNIAPKACENFIGLVKKGYYNGVIFHRVIKNFMVQSGDPTGTGRGGSSIWKKEFEDEFKANVVFSKGGILAMANHGKNTNGSQFFITTRATPWLNGYHTIFGEVVDGFKTLSAIENAKTNSQDRPLQTIKIINAKVINF